MARPEAVAGELVLLQARALQTDDAALNSLARATGEAKASHLRRALSEYLTQLDLTTHTTTSVVTRVCCRFG